MLGRASSGEEVVLTVDLDLLEIEEFRVGWPFLRDRRIDAYSDLTKRFLAREGDNAGD